MQVVCPKAGKCLLGSCTHKTPHIKISDCKSGCSSEKAGPCVESNITFVDDLTEEEDG
jgi:hypothetical protein